MGYLFHNDQNKQEKARQIAELFMVIDEKGNEFELTDRGIAAWAEPQVALRMILSCSILAMSMLESSQSERPTTARKVGSQACTQHRRCKAQRASHNLRQLLRAHLMMERDIDYIIDNDKIVIIDEHTGRPQPGRRFSDGLHQAIEAKEGVAIQRETQTYATITLQNYFRMYDKLAGMTGTAITEANEFKEIYKLDVLQIPTYKACERTDFNDEIYMTEREKYNAILKEVKEAHGKGRPILLGTESVEVSEKLSRILRQNQIPHTVLNAKHHAQEAEIIAEAGKPFAMTVSTNMAGRGTDIKLKGDSAARGGLFVIGTTRHQSRRIDRQLRGRSARLGDPGSSKFFISFEDQLLRLFASPRLTTLIQRFRPPEGEAISAGMLNRSIETAQKRVEARNYTIRKYTLEYDDVMNKQRQEVYSFRNEILQSDNLLKNANELLYEVCKMLAAESFVSKATEGGWDPEGFRQKLIAHFPVSFEEGFFDNDHYTLETIEELAWDKINEAFTQKYQNEVSKAQNDLYGLNGEEIAQDAIRGVIINKIDTLWQEHLLTMDHLRSEVSLRSVAQRDPLLEFKHEAFRLFHELTKNLHMETARQLFKIEIRSQQPAVFEQMLSQINLETSRLIFGDFPEPAQVKQAPPPQTEQPRQLIMEPVTAAPKVGRNDLCPCESGKKYKKCCGVDDGTDD